MSKHAMHMGYIIPRPRRSGVRVAAATAEPDRPPAPLPRLQESSAGSSNVERVARLGVAKTLRSGAEAERRSARGGGRGPVSEP